MSHFIERKEKNCLNCGTRVGGRYCQNCGQENVEPKETVWHLFTHFFNDFTHFDGKFFTSLKFLLFRPALLSKEYMIGKRAAYLNPIRMYIFVSAVFFLVFFNVMDLKNRSFNIPDQQKKINKGDSLKVDSLKKKETNSFHISPSDYKTKEEYDSVLRTGTKKHNWLERKITYKSIELKEKYKGNPNEEIRDILDHFVHVIPQMFFVLLPFFALLLKLIYIRQKKYYYADHGIFTLHFYCFLFINFLVLFGIRYINSLVHWRIFSWLSTIISIWIFVYLYKAMRNFYQQSRLKTIGKFILLLTFFTVVLLFVFTSFFLFTLLK
ncbi:DUF3667 domain-containing protein [soil metagenome]